jgi:O-antigen ligase
MKQQPRVSKDTAKKLPPPGWNIKVENLAFWFWFFEAIEGCLTFVFFQSNPVLGTLVGYLPPAGYGFFLVSSLLIGCRIRQSEILKPMAAKLLLSVALWSGITLFWTGASPLFSAFGYWATLTLKIFVVLLLLSLENIERVAIKSLQGFAWGSLLYALVPFVLKARTIDGRLGNEEFFHPNNIGEQMAFACLCTIYLALQSWGRSSERRPYILILVFLLFTLLRSLSKTSILSFLIAALVYVIRSKITVQRKITLLSVAGVVIAISSAALSAYLDKYLNEQQGGEALETASGRTIIWEIAWQMIQENPIWGYGYQSYRNVAPQIIQLRLVHPHNEWLNIWFNLGGVGMVLGVLTYIAYAWEVRGAAQARLPQEALGLALMIFSLIRGLTEANIPDFLCYPSSLLMLMIGWMSQRNQASSSKRDSHG